jgi:hypothetical protein
MESDLYFSKYFLNSLWFDRLKYPLNCLKVLDEGLDGQVAD